MGATSVESVEIEQGMLVGLRRPNDDSGMSEFIWRIAKTHGCGPFRVHTKINEIYVSLVYTEGEQEGHFVEIGSGASRWINIGLFEPWS